MRWLIATITAIVSLAPLAARAADLPLPALGVYAPPPAYRAVANWGGFYVGGNFGLGLARDRSNFSTGGVTFATADTALFGAVGGGQAGSIGKPVHWSWAWKAIMTGVIPKVA